jgi:D-alanyl-D-alanine dipeptidase
MIRLLKVRDRVVRLSDLSESTAGYRFDVRYARKDNFLGRKVYPEPKAFLLAHVEEDLHRAQRELARHGFGILVFDGYRPWSVTKLFWDESSEHDRGFLADPAKGSSHNRGCAIDLSLFDLKSGNPAPMPSDFDEMNEKAHALYDGGTLESRQHRDLLRRVMESNGFKGISVEWWHFNHESHLDWPVMNFSFEEIAQAPKSSKS